MRRYRIAFQSMFPDLASAEEFLKDLKNLGFDNETVTHTVHSTNPDAPYLCSIYGYLSEEEKWTLSDYVKYNGGSRGYAYYGNHWRNDLSKELEAAIRPIK